MNQPNPSNAVATGAVDRYLAALNEPDAAARRRLIEQSWLPEGGMIDPPSRGRATTASPT